MDRINVLKDLTMIGTYHPHSKRKCSINYLTSVQRAKTKEHSLIMTISVIHCVLLTFAYS